MKIFLQRHIYATNMENDFRLYVDNQKFACYNKRRELVMTN